MKKQEIIYGSNNSVTLKALRASMTAKTSRTSQRLKSLTPLPV